MSREAWIAVMTPAGLPLAVADSLVEKLSWFPRYGLAEALAEYPQLADAGWEPVRSLVRNYQEQKGGEIP